MSEGCDLEYSGDGVWTYALLIVLATAFTMEMAVYVEMGLALLYLFFSMISDCGYGHFCYVLDGHFNGIWRLYCVALLSSHGNMGEAASGCREGIVKGAVLLSGVEDVFMAVHTAFAR